MGILVYIKAKVTVVHTSVQNMLRVTVVNTRFI